MSCSPSTLIQVTVGRVAVGGELLDALDLLLFEVVGPVVDDGDADRARRRGVGRAQRPRRRPRRVVPLADLHPPARDGHAFSLSAERGARGIMSQNR